MIRVVEYNLNFIKIYDLLKHITNFFYISHIYSILKNVILHFTALFDTKSQKEKSVQLYYVRIIYFSSSCIIFFIYIQISKDRIQLSGQVGF